ncbi:MAG: Glu-tRNA(Gln) amidotransferase subunit GatD [Methanophagales archaeon]|nr:Glu-tRNA(Gln) amidotransferase subunit GatD [Methanophagales archaeon]MCW3141240.1 Glu-tRNA(Gln) amidotransferase subunit GatD [Methanophagales archaeon]
MELKEGDRIRIKKKTDSGVVVYEGIVMPTASRNIVIKLDSGYNIGIRPENVEIEVISGVEALKGERGSEKRIRKVKEDLPILSILSTGGTIASKVDYRTGAVSPQFSTEDILETIPELGQIANIKGKVIYSILSENMRAEYWRKLAAEVYREIKNGAEGIIVTHGTDTMGYTAAALSFMVQTPVPIVLVGSQRSADRPSSDAAMNAICAARVACSDLAEVVVVMHGSTSDDFCFIHRGTKVRKMHTSARYAFQSVNDIPIGRVYYDTSNIEKIRLEFFSAYKKRGDKELELGLRDKLEEKCCLIKFYPGADPAILDFFITQGYKGIVLEGTGLGHVSAEWIPGVARAVKQGIPLVMTSQCLYGTICDRVYDTGRDLLHAGIIEGDDMLPETALVKLMWVLGQTTDMEEVRHLMHENIAGEIRGRSVKEKVHLEI